MLTYVAIFHKECVSTAILRLNKLISSSVNECNDENITNSHIVAENHASSTQTDTTTNCRPPSSEMSRSTFTLAGQLSSESRLNSQFIQNRMIA